MRILIVDDDYVSRVKLKTLLADYGDCDSVPNGQLALEMFKSAHKEKMPYDLVTMDIVLPDLDGKEVVKEMRSWESDNRIFQSGKDVKILMVSNMNDGKNIFSSFSKGAEWYLRKPITPENVDQSMQEMGYEKE